MDCRELGLVAREQDLLVFRLAQAVYCVPVEALVLVYTITVNSKPLVLELQNAFPKNLLNNSLRCI